MNDFQAQYLGEERNGSRHTTAAVLPAQELPHALGAEEGVLGSMMIGGAALIEECRAKLPDQEAFYHPAHRVIYGYLLAAQASGMAVDLITFTQALQDANELQQVGGAAYLTHLFAVVPTPINIGFYLGIVREKWILRTIIDRCTETTRRAYEEQDDVDGLLNDHVGNVIEIGQLASPTESVRHISEFVPAAVQEIEATYYSRGKTIGLPSGFVDLDRMTGGFQAPLTYYFAGRPAMGKSSVMVEVAEHIAIANAENGVNVGIFSIEMTGRQLAKRMICSRGEINLQRLRDGFLTKDTLPRMKAAAETVAAGHIWIDEKSNLSIFEFRARARRAVTKMKCRVLIIDYIQRMHSTSRRAQGNREQEMNEIAQGISATAKDLNIPIIVLAQLNRKNEERGDKVPALSDLRESGSMEQEARFVGLLHRPVYYAPNDVKKAAMAERHEMSVEDFEQHAELIVAKQNEGPVGTINLRFVKEYARFENVTEKLYSNNPDQRQSNLKEDDDL